MTDPLRNLVNGILKIDANGIIAATPEPLKPLVRAIRHALHPFANTDDNNNARQSFPVTQPSSPETCSPSPESPVNPKKDKEAAMEVESVPVVETPVGSPMGKGKRVEGRGRQEQSDRRVI